MNTENLSQTLVLGMGNEIRCDDGVGLVVANIVEERLKSAECGDVSVRTSHTGGLDLIYDIEGFDRLIVVDSYFAEESKPGRVRVLQESDLYECNPTFDSAHLMSLPSALALSKKLGYHTPVLIGIVTIDVGDNCMTFGEGLSDEVAAAAEMAIDEVLSLIKLP